MSDEEEDNYFDNCYGDDNDEDYDNEDYDYYEDDEEEESKEIDFFAEVKLADVIKNKYDKIEQILACKNKVYASLQMSKFIDKVKGDIIDIAKQSDISKGRSFLLLSFNNFNKKKCNDIPEELMDDIFYNESKQLTQAKNTKECLLCFDVLTKNSKYSLECNHYFCKDCFKEYVKTCFKVGQDLLFKRCPMDGCKERLGLDEFNEFLNSEQEQNVIDKFILKDALSKNKSILSCPSPNCDYVQENVTKKANLSNQLNVKCQCGGYFCNLCYEDAHLPCTCEMLGRWNKLISGQTDSGLNEMWLSLYTKQCPKCKVIIEKNKGCMHMQCVNCKYHFCWLCMGEYVQHNDFYSCNKYKEETNSKLTQDEKNLKRYNFYSDRFKDHIAGVKLTTKEAQTNISDFSFQLLNTIIIEEKFLEFYSYAYEVLIEAKKATAYTYPIGYYIEDNKRQFFEFQQGSVESQLNVFEDLLAYKNHLSLNSQNKKDINAKFINYKQEIEQKTTQVLDYLNKMLLDFRDELPQIQKVKSIQKENSKRLKSLSISKQISKTKQQNITCEKCKKKPAENDYGYCNKCLNQVPQGRR